ncbi:MAG: hypothetical protein NTV39_00780 [Candidatus Saccharibacteria bacterium]|nr:hypothetical protein [Candidatus Saccharibacteria bacterium]
MVQQRLPAVNGDDGVWGDILNQFLETEHYNTGADNAANGGHKTITLRPGTVAANTAPIKLASGPLMTTPETGAIEFLDDKLYFTQTTSAVRKVIAAYDDASGDEGDIYYRNSSGTFLRLPIGAAGEVLQVTSNKPDWGGVPAAGTDGLVQYSKSSVMGSTANFTYDEAHSRVTIGESPAVLPNNPLALVGDVDNYLQVNLQNKNTGGNVSADYIITANNGDDTQNYADFGLNGSGYNNTTWEAVGPNDGYLEVDGGNLVIGSMTPSKKVKFFIAGTNHESHPADIVAEISSSGINLPAGKKYYVNGAELIAGGSSTASNIGTSGVGVFKNKVGLDFKFKKLVADSAKITITDNTVDDTVGINLGTVALADLTTDSTHRLVTDAQLTVIGNTSNTNTGDQVADGTTITGAGTVGSPFVASAQSDQSLKTTDSPSFANLSLTGLSTSQLVIDSNSVKTAIQEIDANTQCYTGGVVISPSFADNGNGSVTLGSGTYNLYNNSSGTGVIKQYVISGNTFTLTDNSENYIYANYNSGTPILSVTTSINTLTHTNTQTLYTIYREGTDLLILDWDHAANALPNRNNRRNIVTNRFAVQTAPILSEVATRTVYSYQRYRLVWGYQPSTQHVYFGD